MEGLITPRRLIGRTQTNNAGLENERTLAWLTINITGRRWSKEKEEESGCSCTWVPGNVFESFAQIMFWSRKQLLLLASAASIAIALNVKS